MALDDLMNEWTDSAHEHTHAHNNQTRDERIDGPTEKKEATSDSPLLLIRRRGVYCRTQLNRGGGEEREREA